MHLSEKRARCVWQQKGKVLCAVFQERKQKSRSCLLDYVFEIWYFLHLPTNHSCFYPNIRRPLWTTGGSPVLRGWRRQFYITSCFVCCKLWIWIFFLNHLIYIPSIFYFDLVKLIYDFWNYNPGILIVDLIPLSVFPHSGR